MEVNGIVDGVFTIVHAQVQAKDRDASCRIPLRLERSLFRHLWG